MTPDSQKFLNILNEAGVEFVVIGGVAMVAHGSARATFDLDLCYRRSNENIEKLCRALEPLHPRLRGAPRELPFRFDVKTVQHGLNFTLATDIGDIDLLGEVAGLGFYGAVLEMSQLKPAGPMECRVLSIDGLLRAKIAAGRKKDLEVIEELKALKDLSKKLGEP
jgi:hypothetical protein